MFVQCAVVCHSMLQCVGICTLVVVMCLALQIWNFRVQSPFSVSACIRVAVCCRVLQGALGCHNALQCVEVCCSASFRFRSSISVIAYMFVAMCCRVLQGFAVCCSLLQCVAV